MPRKKKVKEKQIVKKEEIRKPAVMGFQAFCQIEKIQPHHRPGMAVFKGASKLCLSLAEWRKLFKAY